MVGQRFSYVFGVYKRTERWIQIDNGEPRFCVVIDHFRHLRLPKSNAVVLFHTAFKMLSFLSGALPPRTNLASENPIAFEDGRSSVHFQAPKPEYAMTPTIPPTTPERGASLVQPPSHYHVSQTEHVCVISGEGTF